MRRRRWFTNLGAFTQHGADVDTDKARNHLKHEQSKLLVMIDILQEEMHVK